MSPRSRFPGIFFTVLLAAALLLTAGPGQKKLRPEFEQFLSEARYIITASERSAFLDMPDSGRPKFIEEFWKKRDPDPGTPQNEFKDEYYGRIAKANGLFAGEARPGWLTDRGRIYILFGPPTDRQPASPAAGRGNVCQELWHYDEFPVVFRDRDCTGTFVLDTFDLSPISQLSLARETAPKPFASAEEKPAFDFDVILRRKKTEPARFEAVVDISFPYKSLWLSFEGGRFTTVFEVKLELRDSRNALVWEDSGLRDVSLTAAELKEKMEGRFDISILILIEKGAESLSQGKNTLLVTLKNTKVGEAFRKKVEFSL